MSPPSDLGLLHTRAQRAFGGMSPREVANQYRAIVGPTSSEDENVQDALEALRNGQAPTPLQLALLENAIRLFRPVISTRQGQVQGPSLATPLPAGWSAFSTAITPYLGSIGRIDRGSRGLSIVPDKVGTGFLVADRVILTNRHVLEILSVGTLQLETGMATIHFGFEKDTANSEDPVDIVQVIAVHPTLDMALLRIADRPRAQPPIPLSPSPLAPGAPVVIIGYPLEDGARNPLFMNALFEGVYGVKRLSPGEVMGLRDEAFFHDCSTLGGNSGSPVFDVASCALAGIHAQGGFATRNAGIIGQAVQTFVAGHP